MLTFILKKEWFDKIKRGEKTVEYREVKPYWCNRLHLEAGKLSGWKLDNYEELSDWVRSYFLICKFHLGYTNTFLYAWIDKVEVVNGKNTDLKIDKPVFAFHFHLITIEEEAKNDLRISR